MLYKCVTWMRSNSCLLAISILLKLFSTSLVLCASFCIRLMYSTDARNIVPLFQRTSLSKQGSRQAIFTCKFMSVTTQHLYLLLQTWCTKRNSQVIGFGDHGAQLFNAIINVESPPPFNYCRRMIRPMEISTKEKTH